MTALSLVMIVRDEAPALAKFFASHAGLWDEAVVVDTGSGDDSAALARAAGARVVSHRWQDDFAAARNAGVEVARGQWILLMDPDESIAARDFHLVREAAGAEPCAWLQEARNYCHERSHLEWRPVRGAYPLEEAGHSGYFASRRIGVFPRDDAIRFRGRIHESVLADCERAGLPVRTLAAPVHHFGYVRSPVVDARRRDLYLRLAARKVADDPGDWSARLEHATALLEDGRAGEAAVELEFAAGGPGDLRPVARSRFLLGRLRREEGNLGAAGELLAAAVRDDPSFLFAWIEWLRLLTAQERWRDFFPALAQARRGCGADEPLLDREELVALVRSGQVEAALAVAERLRAACPAWPQIAALHDQLRRASARRQQDGT